MPFWCVVMLQGRAGNERSAAAVGAVSGRKSGEKVASQASSEGYRRVRLGPTFAASDLGPATSRALGR
jgi:hypothetical protein